jgi:hypothetical protein
VSKASRFLHAAFWISGGSVLFEQMKDPMSSFDFKFAAFEQGSAQMLPIFESFEHQFMLNICPSK